MKYEIIIPKGEKSIWIFLSLFISFILIFFFYQSKDTLSPTMVIIILAVIMFILLISVIMILGQFSPNFIEIKNDGIFYCGPEGKKNIPYSDLKKIIIFESQANKLHKIVTKSEEIFVNREMENIESFIKNLEKYIEKTTD